MSDKLNRYRRILYEEMGWDDKLEELEKEGAVPSSSPELVDDDVSSNEER